MLAGQRAPASAIPHARVGDGLMRALLPLDAAALAATASRRTGLADFGAPAIDEPLAALIRALNAEADLGLFGRISARQHLGELLETRLRLVDAWTREPAMLEAPVAAPIVVTGLARSGTTLLHALFAQDPAHRAPRNWEIMFPWPRPREDDPAARRRMATAARRVRVFGLIAPSVRRMHPLGPLVPQECGTITAFSLYSQVFEQMFRVPAYQAWLRGQDLAPAYAFHRRFLQYLQHDVPPRRWVLKDPSHLYALDTLIATYPDVRIVHAHRDPLKVIGSAASLMDAVHRAFGRSTDRAEVGAEVAGNLGEEMRRAMAFRASPGAERVAIADVHYRDLARDPMATMRRLYDTFGMELTAETEQRMRTYLAEHPKHKNGRHVYRLEDFGLDAGELRARYAGYSQQFGVESEVL